MISKVLRLPEDKYPLLSYYLSTGGKQALIRFVVNYADVTSTVTLRGLTKRGACRLSYRVEVEPDSLDVPVPLSKIMREEINRPLQDCPLLFSILKYANQDELYVVNYSAGIYGEDFSRVEIRNENLNIFEPVEGGVYVTGGGQEIRVSDWQESAEAVSRIMEDIVPLKLLVLLPEFNAFVRKNFH